MSLDDRGDEDRRPSQPTYWHALREQVELGIAEINRNAETFGRALGGERGWLTVNSVLRRSL